MKFNYKQILGKAPCYVLIKNLRYLNNDINQEIEHGEIISFSQDLKQLTSLLNQPKLQFSSVNQFKRFLYAQGFFSDLNLLFGKDLIEQIHGKSFSEIDPIFNGELNVDEVLKYLLGNGGLKKWKIQYDFGGTAYHNKNKLPDYYLYNETYDIRFFGGNDIDKLFAFLELFFKKQYTGIDTYELLNKIRFSFFEMMDSFDGEQKIYPYDLWHEYLNYLYNKDIISDEVYRNCIEY